MQWGGGDVEGGDGGVHICVHIAIHGLHLDIEEMKGYLNVL